MIAHAYPIAMKKILQGAIALEDNDINATPLQR